MGSGNSKKDGSLNEPLTPNDLDLIRSSWEAVSDKDELGIRLMIKMFSLDPEIKYLWIFASNLETEEEMWQNSELKYHARKVVNTVAKVLTALISAGNIDPAEIIRLGRRHHTYGLKKEHFKVNYYIKMYLMTLLDKSTNLNKVFEDALVHSLGKVIRNKHGFDDKVKKAWRKAIRFIFNQFWIGISAELKEIEEQENLKKNLKQQPQQSNLI